MRKLLHNAKHLTCFVQLICQNMLNGVKTMLNLRLLPANMLGEKYMHVENSKSIRKRRKFFLEIHQAKIHIV